MRHFRPSPAWTAGAQRGKFPPASSFPREIGLVLPALPLWKGQCEVVILPRKLCSLESANREHSCNQTCRLKVFRNSGRTGTIRLTHDYAAKANRSGARRIKMGFIFRSNGLFRV